MQPKRQHHDRIGNRILLACGIFVALGLAGAIWIRAHQVPVDANTLCPEDRPSEGTTLLLIDKTDPMSKKQVDVLKREMTRLGRQLHEHERLSIFLIDSDVDRVIYPVFSRCSPGSSSRANPVYENPRLISERFATEFGQPLNQTMDALVRPETHPSSPILEAIRDATATPEFAYSNPPRRLIIASDMLQNVPEFSLYKGVPRLGEFMDSPYAVSLHTALRGARVQIIALERREFRERQDAKFENFWRKYLVESGAASVDLEWR